MTPNQVKTFAAAIDISQTSEVNARLEEFDALVGTRMVPRQTGSREKLTHTHTTRWPTWKLIDFSCSWARR
jgi:hypothetical protein